MGKLNWNYVENNYSLRLQEGESVQTHIKTMKEIFDGLSVIGDPIQEEDRVVYLLASLPEYFNIMLVTALEANPALPQIITRARKRAG